MANRYLYPENTATRQVIDLSGMWKFAFDFNSEGEQKNYKDGIPDGILLPVPASFADFFTEKQFKEYTGDFWYETEFYADAAWKDRDVDIRFFAAAHIADVYFNGRKVAHHNGGFLPFSVNVGEMLNYDAPNKIVVKLNNELSHTTLPCGESAVKKDGKKFTRPYFDFFNYSGLIRPVKIVVTPKNSIVDVTLNHRLDGTTAYTDYVVETVGKGQVEVKVFDEQHNLTTVSTGKEATVTLQNARLWKPLDAYLYTFEFSLSENGKVLDVYELKVGIRTVSIDGNRILINGDSVYFKGFGKHEDSAVCGRGFNLPFIKRDFELMKWIGANSFRTSHYPYSEEIYQLADREGFLIIDELPAVGMLVSTRNAVDAATAAKIKPFFDEEIVQTETLKNHLNTLEECVQRDKNYASVVAWSLFNEPDTTGSEKAVDYFEKVFDKCRQLDKQKRPCSFAHIIASQPDKCLCTHLTDFVMLNRYYGWYLLSGYELDDAFGALDNELSKWDATGKPVIFTEYGTDTLQGLTRLPAIQWTENYQQEYLDGYHEVFDRHSCIMGEQIWNFADFQTTEGLIRVDGNKKGIFTRERNPKSSAFWLKKRWDSLPIDFKGNK